MYKKIINCREALSRSNGMGGELYNAKQKATYRQELQFLEAQEPQPPEPAELTAPPSPPVLLKLKADKSFSISLPPHWGHFSGNLLPNTRSSKSCWHPLQ
jgi:hypothetical protein